MPPAPVPIPRRPHCSQCPAALQALPTQPTLPHGPASSSHNRTPGFGQTCARWAWPDKTRGDTSLCHRVAVAPTTFPSLHQPPLTQASVVQLSLCFRPTLRFSRKQRRDGGLTTSLAPASTSRVQGAAQGAPAGLCCPGGNSQPPASSTPSSALPRHRPPNPQPSTPVHIGPLGVYACMPLQLLLKKAEKGIPWLSSG